MPLTAADPHHWSPVPAVVEWLTNRLAPDARVLEIGPGHAPFWRADVFVDFVEPVGFYSAKVPDNFLSQKFVKCDVATEPLPFADKSFDFVYCRHTLEDMYNPFPLCKEMERVGKAGYIETPSPVAELCRGVDGGAPLYRGYHHHRFVIWTAPSTVYGQSLCFVSKYPLVEHLPIDDAPLANHLRQGPRYWNTYYLWQDRIDARHFQSPLDYDIPRAYGGLLSGAVEHSVAATDAFYSRLPAAADGPVLFL